MHKPSLKQPAVYGVKVAQRNCSESNKLYSSVVRDLRFYVALVISRCWRVLTVHDFTAARGIEQTVVFLYRLPWTAAQVRAHAWSASELKLLVPRQAVTLRKERVRVQSDAGNAAVEWRMAWGGAFEHLFTCCWLDIGDQWLTHPCAACHCRRLVADIAL